MTKERGSPVELMAGYQATSVYKCVENNGAQNPSPRAMATFEGLEVHFAELYLK